MVVLKATAVVAVEEATAEAWVVLVVVCNETKTTLSLLVALVR